MADGIVTIDTRLLTNGLEKGINSISGHFGGLTKTVLKTTAAITAAFTALSVTITTMAVNAYADYEQLTGGIETMFKNSAEKVKGYAEDAFYTAGVDANRYMELVTSFSASLISSLKNDTEQAAEVANMALIDMSDNVAKLGSTMESIQTAYQGFSKQQYQLLDNLKLGYFGTKTEMERLLKDAEAYSGVKYDINNLADVYKAIHAIQEKLGITGTTAKEAEKTISGAANMVKASWKNVLTAIAGGGDMDKAIKNFTFSVSKYFKNLVPVVKRALSGVGGLIAQVAPQMIETLASSLVQAIPYLIEAVYKSIVGMVKGIGSGIKALITGGSKEASAQLSGVAGSANDAADAENNLAAGITNASKAAKKSLAGFDELNRLQSNTDDVGIDFGDSGVSVDVPQSGAADSVTAVGDAAEEATGKMDALIGKVEELYYETIGKTAVENVANLNNAVLMVNNSWKKMGDAISADFDQDEATDFMAKAADFNTSTATAFLTMASGYMDMWSAEQTDDGFLSWKGLGRIGGGVGQMSVAWAELWGVEEIAGVSIEKLREAYLPVFEEIPNLYRGLTTDQAKALKKMKDQFKDFNRDVTAISWSSSVITEEDIQTVLASYDEILAGAAAQAEQSKQAAMDSLNDMVSKGLMSDDEAKAAHAKLEETYTSQETLLSGHKGKIEYILTRAMEEERALTLEERELISRIEKNAQDHITSTIQAGANDRLKIEAELAAAQNGLSKVRLSQIIQFANDEYNEKVAAADKTYQETIAEADKLYYELGVIDQNRYNEIVANAAEERAAQVKAAQDARTELVGQAQDTADEVAATVDPETGEILSNWEVTWNNAYTKFQQFAADIKNIPKKIANFFIDAVNYIIKGWNKLLSFELPGWAKSIPGLKDFSTAKYQIEPIPPLARGAVLPANKPFMALVGDQRHGTNIEAPLTTIQEAVAIVMNDQLAAMMSGFEALLAEARALRGTVESIEVGDSVIGQAAERYNRQQAIITGGAL